MPGWLPNLISFFRILLIPIFTWSFFEVPPNGTYYLPVVVLCTAGISDALDGFIARKYSLQSKLGAILDPLADKLMLLTAVGCLWARFVYLWPLFMLCVSKEVAMLLGSLLLLRKKRQVSPARWYGKVSTMLFYIAVLSVMLLPTFVYLHVATGVLLAVFTLFTFFMYLPVFTSQQRQGDDIHSK